MTSPHDTILQTGIGGGLGLVALVTAEVVTGWARATSAVVGAMILLVTLANGVVILRKNIRSKENNK